MRKEWKIIVDDLSIKIDEIYEIDEQFNNWTSYYIKLHDLRNNLLYFTKF